MSIELMKAEGDNYYIAPDHTWVMAREYGLCPQGTPLKGRWVLREFHTGKYIDHDGNRHDLFERQQAKVMEL
jgi:hypothetical protein